MKSNSKRHEGFTLLEIVISMAIIAIISVGVYNAYVMIIKQTKAGEVKQTAALEGKKVIEGIKSSKFSNSILSLDDKTINLNQDNTIRLDKDYKACTAQNSDNYVYIEEIKFVKNEGLSLSNDSKIGYLYDVTVRITDKKGNELFSGNYNKNINSN